jgi:hypothetical protein
MYTWVETKRLSNAVSAHAVLFVLMHGSEAASALLFLHRTAAH